MKRVRLHVYLLALGFLTSSAFGQGLILFENDENSLVRADTMIGPNEPVNGVGLRAGLYFSLTENGAYTKVAEASFYAPGRFSAGPVAISGGPGGTPAWFQVRVWEQAFGADYESAITSPPMGGRGAVAGVSNKMNLVPGVTVPTPLVPALQSFTVSVVPEPSAYVLGLFGLAGWFMLRRRS